MAANKLRANNRILAQLERALRHCDITDPTVCAANPAAAAQLKLYVDSWIKGPLESAILDMKGLC